MKKLLQIMTSASILVLLSSSVNAAFITGSVGFSGTVGLVDINNLATTSFTNAVGFDFSNAFVLESSGDFTTEGLTLGTAVTFNDFNFSPSLSPSPVDPLWASPSANPTLDFVLESVTVNQHDNTGINLSGTGVIRSLNNNYDDTSGTWNFSTQGGTINGRFTFSADSHPVPEPSTYAMFGTAFAILGFVGYRKRRA